MVRGARLVAAVAVCWAFLAAPALAEVTVSPSNGPPGTTVTVSGVTTCEGSQPTLTFSTSDGRRAVAPSIPFTPPSGTLTVPNVAPGDYAISLSCGAGEGFVAFAVRAAPGFTG